MKTTTNKTSMKTSREKKHTHTSYSPDFDTVALKVASPEKILSWSYGEVTKPETINYRTQRSEKSGLFDEKIFGPEKDYECYCGKYRGIRYKGIVCEKCGVEVTRSIVRRERMGHIELATPVSHIWFLKGIPSRVALLLGSTISQIEKVVYFAAYIVTSVSEEHRTQLLKDLDSEYKSKLKTANDEKTKSALKDSYVKVKKEIESVQKHTILEDTIYNKFAMKYGSLFEAEIGAEALYNLFVQLDLEKHVKNLDQALAESGAVAEREKLRKQLALTHSLINAKIRPEWMFLKQIPVLPPALRPMVALDGGRHATSDVNDLYRRVINRNNRLKKLLAINAPEVILRNEKRILQEAVDALIDNSIRRRGGSYAATNQAQRRPLKSLADNLKSKQGIFRQNLLGKRVDYSGRSVIVVGPHLALDECGIPKIMALELFRPFVISKLLESELAYNIRGANKLIDEGIPEVWAILEDVIKDKYVLLNRAPTLHRLGIQAFRPILIEGFAIQIHPLVCTAFNADFDGDQMAVHVPLSKEAQAEAKFIMASNRNLLKPGNGRPVVSGKMLDVVLGCFWMTRIVDKKKGEGKVFTSPNEAITAFDYDQVDFRARIKVLATDNEKYAEFKEGLFETSVGRLLFNSVLPNDYPYINKEIDSKVMQSIVDELIEKYGTAGAPQILDKIKTFGFRYATYAGITWGLDDVRIPEGRDELIEGAQKKIEELDSFYDDGLLSGEERSRKAIDIWHHTKNEIESLISEKLDTSGSVYDMWKSGARGSLSSLTVMAGMKGLIVNNKGEVIDFPITTSSSEGHTPIEYFITTHGSRKGLTDTALQTARAGYLTRKLFDVAQDVIVTEKDCGTKRSIAVKDDNLSGIIVPVKKNIVGRFLAEDVLDSEGKTLLSAGHFVTAPEAEAVEEAGVISVSVRSPMTCDTNRGLCQKCYGADLGTGNLIELGEAVGTVAAQAIGEPGTQLTMRTFHSGGTASVGGDITMGLPRVEEIFERRIPKNSAVVSKTGGMVLEVVDGERGEKFIRVLPHEGEVIKKKKVTKTKTKKKESDDEKSAKETEVIEYKVHLRRMALVKKGDEVARGQLLTDGSADLRELFKFGGVEATQNYVIREVGKIYETQGASISRKHIEVIVRQMFSRVKITDPGDTKMARSRIMEIDVFDKLNKEAKKDGRNEAKANSLIMGITEIALSRNSFLSAASFQHTTRVLIDAAISGRKDKLVGLKENVIVGRLIPAGSAFKESPKAKIVANLHGQDEEMGDE